MGTGSLLELSRQDVERLRSEDPDLCVGLLITVISRQQSQLRTYMWFRVEPDEVELVDGVRRRFTIDSTPTMARKSLQSERFDPVQNLHEMVKQAHSTLARKARKTRDSVYNPWNRASAHVTQF